ncbi:MAG: hypothetical protein ACOYMW_08720 [Candidatus Competibacteraceae bacterium]
MANISRPLSFVVLLFGLLLLTALAYNSGLGGSLQLDDTENLRIFQEYEAGRITAREVIFGNESGHLGRPVAMLSFWLDWISNGGDPASLKYHNLLLHLLNGVLIFSLIVLLLREDSVFGSARHSLALAVVAFWWLSPMQVSTVLYVIQRMAQLSTCFTLLGLIAYTSGRLLSDRQPRWDWILIGTCFLICMPLAALSKENGLLLPLLALLVEGYCFQFSGSLITRRGLQLLFIVTVALPAVLAVSWLLLHPGMVLSGYESRDFSFTERLLTEPRILWDYVRQLLVPDIRLMGLVHDDFPLSRSLFDPPQTVLAIIAWLVVISIALFASRTPLRMTGFGVLFFLAGHVLESSIFPLELYFEHRNYLPSVGLYLAVVTIGFWLAQRYRHPRLALAGLLMLIGFYTAATVLQARDWAEPYGLIHKAALYHPASPRSLIQTSLAHAGAGDAAGALALLNQLEQGSPHNATAIALQRLLTHCLTQQPLTSADYQQFAKTSFQYKRPTYLMRVFEVLTDQLRNGHCEAVDLRPLLPVLRNWLTTPVEPDPGVSQWYLLYHLSNWYAHYDDSTAAISLLGFAWEYRPHRIEAGLRILELQLSRLELAAAEQTLQRLNSSTAPKSSFEEQYLKSIPPLIDQLRQLPPLPVSQLP